MSKANSPRDCVAGYFGARGSGKNYGAEQDMGAPARALFMDPMDQWGHRAARVGSMVELVKRATGARFALRYVPPDITDCSDAELARRFDVFCRLAWRVAPVEIIVDEGHLFTSASFAPKAWRACTLLGRHRGITIRLMSQRPAHVDKHFFSNATYLRCGRLNFEDDIATMAGALRVPRADVSALVGHEWIARELLTGRLICDRAQVAAPAPAVYKKTRAGRANIQTKGAPRRRVP